MDLLKDIGHKLERLSNNQRQLYWLFVAILMFTNVLLLFTEKMDILSMFAFILIPLGIQMIFLALFHKPGIGFLLLFPKIFIDAFQFVLIILWGGSIIAVDMFLNLATTNAGEAMELLQDLLPALIIICIVYVSGIIFAIKSAHNKTFLEFKFRINKIKIGIIITIFGIIALIGAREFKKKFNIKYDLYPVNVFYNLDYAIQKGRRIENYPKTSEGFKYNATHKKSGEREIYMLILGETGRAANWSMYGYNRVTTPHLDTMSNIIKYSDMLTQSNTTHKIVSLLLTPADASRYNQIYKTKSIVTAFSEAGFKTAYITNQEYNKTFMQYYLKEADIVHSIRSKGKNIDDHAMLPIIEQILKENASDNLFIFVHLYGSHFKYQQRYEKRFAKYKPDNAENISKSSLPKLVNAFDNSILNTDDFIYNAINLVKTENNKSLVLYLSDHGEDLMDDKRGKFLHASPIPTYYQMHIPYIVWFSDKYISQESQKYKETKLHKDYPLSNNTVFHSLINYASIKTPYFDSTLAIGTKYLKVVSRTYLDDHDEPVEISKLPLTKYDYEQFRIRGLKIY